MGIRRFSPSLRLINWIVFLILVILPMQSALAVRLVCRTDPLFFFSNGSRVVITLSMDTAEANVERVVYRVHVPAGVTLDRVVFTAGGIGQEEVVEIVDDAPAGVYITDTRVFTSVENVNITATSLLTQNITATAIGHEGDSLVVRLAAP